MASYRDAPPALTDRRQSPYRTHQQDSDTRDSRVLGSKWGDEDNGDDSKKLMHGRRMAGKRWRSII
ncbi:hypothetical protein E2C01_036453 [Portunus trituberculatus]|uniref:Uncharacterized protein n=1 Tax=Portunus trituberculatus TaxID=210409 RepID=A0A5B7F8R5_PORTR|nr:hypothetical protein [Portunus trituberculatus]